MNTFTKQPLILTLDCSGASDNRHIKLVISRLPSINTKLAVFYPMTLIPKHIHTHSQEKTPSKQHGTKTIQTFPMASLDTNPTTCPKCLSYTCASLSRYASSSIFDPELCDEYELSSLMKHKNHYKEILVPILPPIAARAQRRIQKRARSRHQL